MPETIFHINLLAAGSIPADGSSNKTTNGFPSMAIAVYSFLLFPPESYSACLYL